MISERDAKPRLCEMMARAEVGAITCSAKDSCPPPYAEYHITAKKWQHVPPSTNKCHTKWWNILFFEL